MATKYRSPSADANATPAQGFGEHLKREKVLFLKSSAWPRPVRPCSKCGNDGHDIPLQSVLTFGNRCHYLGRADLKNEEPAEHQACCGTSLPLDQTGGEKDEEHEGGQVAA